MPDQLPSGWTWASFSDLFQVASDGGRRLPQSEYKTSGKFPVIDQGEKDPGGFTDEELAYEGDLPVILFGDHTRRFKLVEHPFVVGAQGVKILRPSREVPVRFLWLAVNGLKIESRGYSRHFQFLTKARLPLAPLPEQERIVAKLDALLSRVTAGEAAARRALERLKRYRAAVLHAAVTGELTREWRKQNRTVNSQRESAAQLLKCVADTRLERWEEAELKRLHTAGRPPEDAKWKKRYPAPGPVSEASSLEHPSTWRWTSLEHITFADRPICYGILMPKQHIPDGIPYVKVRDMKGDQINVAQLQRTSHKIAAAYARATLRDGDLVLAIRGTYGRIAVVPPELDGGNITQDTARLAVCPPVHSPYVMWAIRSDFVQTHFKKVARGVAVKGVNIADVRATPLPLPPVNEQGEIVREVERRFAAADRLTVTLNRQQERARAMRQSMLREAFAGHLLSQDPKDEPASVLLKRIRTAREAEAKEPKAKRMPKSKLKPAKRPLLEVLREHKKPMTAENLFRESGYESLLGESDEPQDVVDSFYRELRELTEKPAKMSQQKDSKHQILLRALP